ncbi:MAG: hypothetical protein ACTHOJ_00470 [Sphingomonas oligoaromativorans]|jgi:hypothetical protein|uniref:hypothetical protein n=1 Tax=Sphingomonas oligoaromativorans TaxID=575322 RepID=UPI001FBA68EB|nr:hypothetical protein [Sphingomonas oligoaromativorans]NIJ31787.1 hypothetical protein [Sphingomonas oligoaromativorans]
MHMKKIVALPLIVAVAMGVAACKKTETAANNADVSADLNAAANDAIADVNAANEAALDNGAAAMDNAATTEANTANAM